MSSKKSRLSEIHPLAVPARIVGRLVHRVTKAPGSAPGTIVFGGQKKVENIRIRMIEFDSETLVEKTLGGIEECLPLEPGKVSWINIDGLHDADLISAIGDQLGFHRLLLEDVVSVGQRAKVEDYDDHIFLVLKMLSMAADSSSVNAEQVSFVVADGLVVSFQERYGDVFEPVRVRLREAKGRLRHRGADYLLYALTDAIVDSYFRLLEQVGDRTEDLEEAALADPDIEVLHRIHHLKREMLVVRRAIWPLREALGSLYRGEMKGFDEDTLVFFRDVYDHVVMAIDTVETLREVLSGTMDLYLSGVSNRMNEVMKVLTIIATIFIPLSFFAGLYGMNFDYMPELHVPWAYPTLLGLMAGVALGMLWFFRKRGWL